MNEDERTGMELFRIMALHLYEQTVKAHMREIEKNIEYGLGNISYSKYYSMNSEK